MTVPASAHSGHIMVLLSHGRYTSSYGPIYLYKHALHPPASPNRSFPPPPPPAARERNGAGRPGHVDLVREQVQTEASVASIIAQAHAADVTTVFVKSSDGASNYWSQFSPQLVQELHAGGLKVCAWQYVYGSNPAGEASLGAGRSATAPNAW